MFSIRLGLWGRMTQCRLWLRFTVLLFGFCLIALIEGMLLRPYGFFWFVSIVGITLFVIVKIVLTLLGWEEIHD
jgi:hypothetical protein